MRWCPLLIVLSLLGFAPAAQAANLDANPGTLTFSRDVTEGPSAAQTSIVTDNAPGLPMSVSVSGPSNADFELLTGDPGDCTSQVVMVNTERCTIRVQFDPSSPVIGEMDTVTVTVGSDSAVINLVGDGTFRQLTASPPAPGIAFGQQSIGAGPTGSQTATFTNNGTGPVTFSGAPAIGGPDASQFQVASTTCASTLAANASCSVNVTFDPSSFGDKSAHLSVPSNSPTAPQVDLSGTGIQAQLSRAPDTLDFSAEIGAGPSAPQAATVTNVGSEAVPISSVVISDPQDFSQLTGGAGDCTAGTTIPVGGSCDVRIAFDPATKGPKPATVTVNSSAPPISIALNGTATLVALDVPGTLDFAALEVGSGRTSIETSTVTNTGTDPVTLGAIRLKDPDTARFMWASGLGSDCAAGRTLAAGETCDLRVVFAPQSDGTKVGTMTVASTAGAKTLLITAAATPGLRIPAFSVHSSRIQNRRLNVTVTPLGGIVSNIVVRIKTRGGAVLGSGTLLRTGSERAVSLHLRSRLRPGTYVATASGRDVFADIVTAPSRQFRVR